ncbi:hypothetical protein MAPG_04838 [Magnaporthiopsis poae ATCC 64411]|uniref:MARVEL domain-containing protein n=1 Tax=Magnaporthiopsis poae (strain ATCC 64411 / 73-15) TaxID=644358 RepID=A0A0C4DXT1_MAGP6|nr:hypothetical protein MAPG_04838 [Magnaporthiopsis poae ATCC 64411]
MPPESAQTPPAEPTGAPASEIPTPPAAPAGPAATAATPGPLSSPRRPSLRERLRASDERWAWKVAIRLLQCVAAVVGIACAAYILAKMADFDDMTLLGRNVVNELFIAFFAVSFAWGVADILVRFLRHYSKPLHPLLILCVDFTFCCVLLYLIAAAVASILSVQRFGDDPGWLRIWHNGTSRGPYNQDSNGVWVYAGGSRKCTPASDCAAQDAAVNAAWSQKPARFALAIVIAAMLVVAGICHFALCVWAGVDSYTRRKRKARELMQGGMMYQPVYVPVPVPVPMQPMGPYDKQVPGHQVPMPGYVYGHEQMAGPVMGSSQTRYA